MRGKTRGLLVLALWLVLAWSVSAGAVDSIGWIGPDQIGDASGAQYARSTWFNVEAGQTFWIGDYFEYFVNYEAHTGSELPITYTSNNPSVASVQAGTGLVATHKAGTAVITARYQGQTYTCTLKVQNKGVLKSTGTYKKMNQAAGKLSKYYGKSSHRKTVRLFLRPQPTI